MSVGKNSISRISDTAKSGTAKSASKPAAKTVKPATETPVETKVEPALSTEITIAAPAKTKTAPKKTAPKAEPAKTVLPKPEAQVAAIGSVVICRLGEELPVYLL